MRGLTYDVVCNLEPGKAAGVGSRFLKCGYHSVIGANSLGAAASRAGRTRKRVRSKEG